MPLIRKGYFYMRKNAAVLLEVARLQNSSTPAACSCPQFLWIKMGLNRLLIAKPLIYRRKILRLKKRQLCIRLQTGREARASAQIMWTKLCARWATAGMRFDL
jgi:hypothetical protein